MSGLCILDYAVSPIVNIVDGKSTLARHRHHQCVPSMTLKHAVGMQAFSPYMASPGMCVDNRTWKISIGYEALRPDIPIVSNAFDTQEHRSKRIRHDERETKSPRSPQRLPKPVQSPPSSPKRISGHKEIKGGISGMSLGSATTGLCKSRLRGTGMLRP
jgi:hypothetical protein